MCHTQKTKIKSFRQKENDTIRRKDGEKEGSEGRKEGRQGREGRKSREQKGKEGMKRGKNEKKKNYQTF